MLFFTEAASTKRTGFPWRRSTMRTTDGEYLFAAGRDGHGAGDNAPNIRGRLCNFEHSVPSTLLVGVQPWRFPKGRNLARGWRLRWLLTQYRGSTNYGVLSEIAIWLRQLPLDDDYALDTEEADGESRSLQLWHSHWNAG